VAPYPLPRARAGAQPSPTGILPSYTLTQSANVRAHAIRRRLLPQVRLVALPYARASSG
jgi:hypothetical protein